MKKRFSSEKIVCLGLAAILTSSALGAGFQLTEMSAKKLGQANAGAAAYGDDASTIFWNAAGLAKLDRQQIVSNASIIDVDAEFTRASAVDAFGNPLSGGNGGDIGGSVAPVPALFYARPGERFSWGIGMHAPFGLTTEYDADSIFRYQAVKSEVKVIDINPAIAWSTNANFHIGFGLDIQYMDVSLSNVVDYGTACFSAVGAINPALIPSLCVGNGLNPQGADGLAVIEGDGFAFGWNIGFMYDVSDNFTLGLSHRSAVKHDLEGDASFANAPAFFTSQGLFVADSIEADFKSPDLTMFSAKWDVNPHWTIAADISHSKWSNFDELNVNYLTSNQPNTVERFEWDDNQRYSLGVEYKHSDRWSFRTGVAYDQTPITEEHRGARLPSNSRTWVALGTSYNLVSGSSIDLAYVHLFIDDPIQFEHTGSLGDTIAGNYKGDTNIFSFQYTHKF